MLKSLNSILAFYMMVFTLNAQTISVIQPPQPLKKIISCTQVNGGYVCSKVGGGKEYNMGYYKLDNNYKILNESNFDRRPSYVQIGQAVVGSSLYLIGINYTRTSTVIDFVCANTEKVNEEKVFHTENYTTKQGGNAMQYIAYLTSPDKQKFYLVWKEVGSAMLNFHVFEYDTTFKQLADYHFNTGMEDKKNWESYHQWIDQSGNLIMLTQAKGKEPDLLVHNLSSGKDTKKEIELPSYFSVGAASLDRKNGLVCFVLQKQNNNTGLFQSGDGGSYLAEPIAEFCSCNITTGNIVRTPVKLTGEEITTLNRKDKYYGKPVNNLDLKEADMDILGAGKVAVVLRMGYRAPGSPAKGEVDGFIIDDMILRVFDDSGKEIASKTLSVARDLWPTGPAYDLRNYNVDDKAFLFTYVRPEGKDKPVMGAYRINENGNTGFFLFNDEQASLGLFQMSSTQIGPGLIPADDEKTGNLVFLDFK